MDFTQAMIYTTTQGVDVVADILEQVGIEGYVLEDAADFADFLQDTQIYWDYVDEALVEQKQNAETSLTVYVTQDAAGEKQLTDLQSRLDTLREQDSAHALGRLAVERSIVRQQDWEWGWKQYFKPFTIGQKFVIKPSWESYTATDDRMILEIDPASSFGTGSHETTQLCITALEEEIQGGERLLDMGTGSGILAIAAAMLGAQVCAYTDIDENCLKCAQENAEKNHVAIGQGFCGDAARDAALAQAIGQDYQIITANIVADVLIGLSQLFYAKLTSDGRLICSGILAERADEVQKALGNAGFSIKKRAMRADWVQLTAVK